MDWEEFHDDVRKRIKQAMLGAALTEAEREQKRAKKTSKQGLTASLLYQRIITADPSFAGLLKESSFVAQIQRRRRVQLPVLLAIADALGINALALLPTRKIDGKTFETLLRSLDPIAVDDLDHWLALAYAVKEFADTFGELYRTQGSDKARAFAHRVRDHARTTLRDAA